jgi:hypothetical protein
MFDNVWNSGLFSGNTKQLKVMQSCIHSNAIWYSHGMIEQWEMDSEGQETDGRE